MDNITSRFRRRFNYAVDKAKPRPSRATRLRRLKKDVLEDMSTTSEDSDTLETASPTQESNEDEKTEFHSEPREGPHSLPQEEIFKTSDEAVSYDAPAEALTGDMDSNQVTPEHVDVVQQGDEADVIDDAESAALLEPEELQAIRDQYYITFTSEDETDYTEGPPRIIWAADGIKNCSALLLTLELSAKIQKALLAQRGFVKARRATLEKKKASLNLSSELEIQIWGRKSRIARLSMSNNTSEAQKQALEEELSILERMRERNLNDRQKLQTDLEFRGQVLRNIQEEANAEIEEAFIHAQLLEPQDDSPDTPIEEFDLQQEYEAFKEELREAEGDNFVPTTPLDTSKDYLMAPKEPLTLKQERNQELKKAVWAADERLQSAQAAFDRRESDRHAEFRDNVDAANRDETPRDTSPEDFNLRWLKHEQDLTRELIEAEKALAAAKAAAVGGGIDVPMDDQASGFVDDVADGYRMSMEQEQIASVPSPRVKNWLSGIPELASPSFNERSAEVDDWEAPDVEISDSVSLVAEGNERRRIDKWRRVCGF